MTKMYGIILAAAGLSLSAYPAYAQVGPVQDSAQEHPSEQSGSARDGRFRFGITAGTLGIGPEIGYRVNRTIGARANATFLSVSHSIKSNDVRYDGKVNLKSGGVMLDLYPFGGGFFLSAGARTNGNDGRLRATPQNMTKIGNMAFTPAQIGTISGRAEVKSVAPQLTLGYGGGLRRGLSFNVEAGALFQGAVRVRDFASNGTLSSDPRFIVELEKERVNIQKKVDDYQVYPILQFGLKYRF
ncbi:hypothetical protein U1872_07325 [Sphingomonas sp. RB3P16]|uniref:hypothetical protein n=1 Tax=Parasphingomonas frigoris TaxID=3096163 RepID=UPI002FCBFFA7